MTASEIERFLPVVDVDSEGYWAAAAEDRLVAQRCGNCGAFRFPPSPVCHRCRSWEASWEELPSVGHLYSWVVVQHAVVEAFADVPYTVGLVEFVDAVRIPGRLRGIEPEECRSGMPLKVGFQALTAEVHVPEFSPAEESGH